MSGYLTLTATRANDVMRWAVLGTVGGAGALVLLVSAVELVRTPVDTAWFALVGLTLLTGWATLRMREVPASFSISDTFTIAAALLFGPAAGTVTVTLDALVISLRIARAKEAGYMRRRVLFNATATALAMWLSSNAFFATTGLGPLASQPGTIREVVGPLAMFAALYFVLNTALIAIAVAYERQASVATVWRAHFAQLWLTYFGGASIAAVLVLMRVAHIVDVKALTLILPLLVILHVAYRAAIDRAQERIEHLAKLASYAAEREALLDGERRARAAADAANRLKDEFLATLSHELRTPATGVLGWARMLRTGRLDELQTRQAIEALERSARAQAALLDDLLDMSRIVRGTLRLELRPTDVKEALKGAADTVEPAIRSKALAFRLDTPVDVPPVYGDLDRLRQVFWNVLSNAVKFTEAGGSINVSVALEPAHVRVEVADSGRGIDPDLLPFIFDRFRQADGSSTRSHGGLGLGLAIVRHLVELHGGTVMAASDGRGRGARFTIRLPQVGARVTSVA